MLGQSSILRSCNPAREVIIREGTNRQSRCCLGSVCRAAAAARLQGLQGSPSSYRGAGCCRVLTLSEVGDVVSWT